MTGGMRSTRRKSGTNLTGSRCIGPTWGSRRRRLVRGESRLVGEPGMTKLLILGSGGRLGAALARIYGADFEVAGLNHAAVDLNSSESIAKNVAPLNFDVLINCAALTNVDYCETHEGGGDACERARGAGTRGDLRKEKGAADSHQHGLRFRRREEESLHRGGSVPEHQHLRGVEISREQELLRVSGRHLAVRVSWVFGPDRPSFIDGILKRALAEERVDAIGDKYSTPAFTLDLAEYLRPFVADIPERGVLRPVQFRGMQLAGVWAGRAGFRGAGGVAAEGYAGGRDTAGGFEGVCGEATGLYGFGYREVHAADGDAAETVAGCGGGLH